MEAIQHYVLQSLLCTADTPYKHCHQNTPPHPTTDHNNPPHPQPTGSMGAAALICAAAGEVALL